MYLSCYRAAEYLTTRPDWDGKTLVVQGGSQGGMQALVTAALHPKVTAALASVPAGCDMRGPDAGRLPGWPMWYWNVGDKDPAKVRRAREYFDVVNFAPRIKCPVLVGIGLIDEVCPPEGILAAVEPGCTRRRRSCSCRRADTRTRTTLTAITTSAAGAPGSRRSARGSPHPSPNGRSSP